jgi:hypothetical protein
VVVDGLDSSEVWGGFRVARRARPVGLSVTSQSQIVVRCAHDGYRRLPGDVEHTREWSFPDRGITIDDRVTGSFEHAEARFHLHPLVVIDEATPGIHPATSLALRLPRGQRVHVTVEAGRLEVVPATWHPEFGRDVPNRCLVTRLERGKSRVHIAWEVVP